MYIRKFQNEEINGQSRDHGTNLVSFDIPLYILLRVLVQGSVSIQKPDKSTIQGKVVHPKYYKHLKEAALHKHLGR